MVMSKHCFMPLWKIMVLCYLTLGLPLMLFAQTERLRANHLFFGNRSGFNFSNNSLTLDTSSAMHTFESSTSMSDKMGNLLFYTNGGGRVDSSALGFIWNRNHEVMEGGELGALAGGGLSSAQGALSILKPGTEDQYYLFTIDEVETLNIAGNPFPEGKGLSYFEIDMSANGGLGAVTTFNEPLLKPAFENQSATLHGNCQDFWLLSRTGYRFLDDNPDVRDSFYLYKISEQGIESPIITAIPEEANCTSWDFGSIQFAPDGEHFICGTFLFDFDKNTGLIGSFIDIRDWIGTEFRYPVAFSPNGDFLYYFKVLTSTQDDEEFKRLMCFQFDIQLTDFSIVGSIDFGEPDLPSSELFGRPQLAPDGKLYVPFHNGEGIESTFVLRVDFPNQAGSSAGFSGPVFQFTPVLGGPLLNFGSYADHIFFVDTVENLDLVLPDDFLFDCQEVEMFTVDAPGAFNCQLWSTGDTSATIEINEEGTYWLEVQEGCDVGRDTFEVVFENTLFSIDLGNDTVLCEGTSHLLFADAPDGTTFEWQDNTDLAFNEVFTEGLYWITADNGYCTDQDSVYIDFLLLPVADLGNDTTLCYDSTLLLQSVYSPDWMYEWQDGSSDWSFIVEEEGIYELTVSNECGTTSSAIMASYGDCKSCKIQFPNVFSPNNDGLSDHFEVLSDCQFSIFNLKIYNRWGNIVFESSLETEGWDGNFKGRASPSDNYIFFLDYETISREGIRDKGLIRGDVTLLR